MLLGLAGSLLKTLGKRKGKGSGKQMSDNIVNKHKDEIDKSQNPTTVFDEKSSPVQGANLKPLEDIRDDMKGSSKKSKDPLNLALDGIDKSLFGIIDTLGNIEKKKLDIAADANKAQQAKKKTLRERFLESGVVKSVVGSVKGAVGNSWDKIMQFLTWTLIGGIVNAIIKNWDEIQQQIKKVVDKLRELYEGLEPILTPIVKWVKWIVTKGIEWTTKIDEKQKEMDHEGKYNEIKKQLLLMDKWKKEFDSLDKDLGNMMMEIQNAESQEEINEILDKYRNKIPQEETKETNTHWRNEKGQIDPITNIRDEETGERLRFSETFGGPPDKEDSASIINEETGEESTYSISEVEEWKDKYYVDQHGNLRHKDTNGKAFGARLYPPPGLEYEQILKMLEKRIYDKKTNTSKLIGESNEQSSIFNLRDSAFNTSSFLDNEIESRTYDLESISKYFDESNIDTTILITGQESSSSFSQVSPFIFSPSGGEDSFTIDEAQLLKLYKE